jgi:cytochrome P450
VFSRQELRDPYATFAKARKESPVFYSEKLGVWSLARQEDVLAVLRDTEHFSSRSAMPVPEPPAEVRDRMPRRDGKAVYPSALTLLLMDDPEHKAARAVIQGAFTPKRVRAAEPMIRRMANQLLDSAIDGRLDFVNDYALPLALRVVCGIVGVPESRMDLVRRAIDGVFALNVGELSTPQEVLAAAEAVAEYWQYISALAEDRRTNPRQDYASAIAAMPADDGSARPTQELAQHIHSIIGPGFETSAQLMSYGVALILTHREQWELLRADRSLIDQAISEMLRYRTVVKRITRFAKADVTVGGVRIPQGAVVTLLLGSANRDEEVYESPARFDITRRADNLAMGRWTHFCVGAPMARMEMKVTVETLLDRFPKASVLEQELGWRRDSRFDALLGLAVDLTPAYPEQYAGVNLGL